MSLFDVDGLNYGIIGAKKVIIGNKTQGFGVSGTKITAHLIIPPSITYKEKKYIVTAINEYAFSKINWLINITIPNTINEIKQHAFWGCYELQNVYFEPGSRLKNFPYKIFDATKIKKVQIPESVVSFEKDFLINNYQLKEIIYCGSTFVESDVLSQKFLEVVYVTPKYKEKTFNGINVTLMNDYVCPTLIYINKIRYICTKKTNNHVSFFNLVFFIVS